MNAAVLDYDGFQSHKLYKWFSWFRKWRYITDEDYTIQTQIFGYEIDTEFIKLTKEGLLTIRKGYRWDGASGPTWDTPSCRRGSCVHDALYWLLRKKLINAHLKDIVDKALRDICIEDDMWEWRANMWYQGVRLVGGIYAR